MLEVTPYIPSPGTVVGSGALVTPGGDQGLAGAQGPIGAKWFTGTGAPGTITGSRPGDLYLDTATGDVWVL